MVIGSAYPVLLIDAIVIKVRKLPGREPARVCRDRREHGR
jgi:hypothetical protein